MKHFWMALLFAVFAVAWLAMFAVSVAIVGFGVRP